MKSIITIEGMRCEHCAEKVKSRLESLDGVSSVHVTNGRAEIESDKGLSDEAIRIALEAGSHYLVEAIERIES